ncbi:TetR family transcriptional regulator [Thioclava sp. BHET1]|nr:TetR family transcriptional regulator [Thioclava sp. BHET1]
MHTAPNSVYCRVRKTCTMCKSKFRIPMAATLRERRRNQTARDIQVATITLALEVGIDNVTTEMISKSAGISQRTFFNYYANKEAAVIGHPPVLTEESTRLFIRGTDTVSHDLLVFLKSHLGQCEPDRWIIRGILDITETSARTRQLHDVLLNDRRGEMARMIGQRLKEQPEATLILMAETLLNFCKIVIMKWAPNDRLRIETVTEQLWPNFMECCTLLSR